MKKALFAALILAASLAAQEFRSTLAGQVLDPQGAAIPGAKIIATEINTGSRHETVSGAEGYTLPLLPPGAYQLTAAAEGFKRYVQERIQIGTNQRIQQDITLQIGAAVESVTVTADVSLLSTSSASVGQVITTRQIENMPMNGRTPLTMAQLAFGVVPSSDPRFTRPFDNAGPSGFSLGGGQAQTNELLIDGGPDMTRNRRVAYNPPVDTVSEVKVEVFQSDAAYGNTGGGTVNVVMKGGTNEFHGTLYEFNQVSRLKATQFFTNSAGQKKAVTRFNQYGLTAGGPVLIPKLYNGRNRVFFYFAYEGIKQSEPEPTFSNVPTDLQRGGNLSNLLALGGSYQIYDPLTGVREGARVRRQPFAGNVIPTNRISPIARNILGLIPGPNTTAAADGRNNYFNNAIRSDNFVSYLGRMDVNASDKHKFFFNYRINDRLEDRGRRYGTNVTGNLLGRVNNGLTFDDVYTWTPTLLMNLRAHWTRFTESNTRPHDGFDFTSLGFPAYMKAASGKNVIPFIDFSDFSDIGEGGGDKTPFDTFQIFWNLTKVTGKHTLKFGADLREQRESSNGFGNSSGRFVFNQTWTRGPLDNAANAPYGQDLASFLLGAISPSNDSNFDVNASRTQQSKYYALFLQDDWRVKSNFTLNLGLRYERETPTTERFNRTIIGFDPTASTSITAAAKAAYAANPNALLPVNQFNPVGGMLFADSNNSGIYNTYAWAFSPRLGFSWSPLARTVIRGGVGTFYSTYGTLGVQQPGFSQRTLVNANAAGDFSAPSAFLSDPFPQGIGRPLGASRGVNTFLGQNFTYQERNLGMPTTWRWSFNLQRELGSNFLFEIGYVGSRATRLNESHDLNFIPLGFLSTAPTRDTANINRVRANVPNPFAGLLPGLSLNGANVSLEQLLRTYPQFNGGNGVRVENQNNGESDFHMLQARFEKRFSSGFSFLSNFQWSKMIEATARLNAADPFLERRIGDEDRPLRFVFSSVYELPFGRGRHFASSASKPVDLLIGGWQIAGIYAWQPGGATDWGNVIYLGGDLAWDPHPNNPLMQSFDTTRFNRVAAEQLDLNRRNFNTRFPTYRADGVHNLDASILKNFSIVERFTVQLRGEIFNFTNSPTFNAPDRGPTSATFGRITSQANLNRSVQLALRVMW